MGMHPSGGIGRRVAITRYISGVPNPAGADWGEVETIRNYVLVKVSAPDALHRSIQRDGDVIHIPTDLPLIPADRRPTILARLEALGFTDREISATGWEPRQLLRLLASAVSEVRERLNQTGFVVGIRLPADPIRLDLVEARVAV